MYEVEEAFPGVQCITTLWWTRDVREELMKFLLSKGKNEQRFAEKLKYYAQSGFRNYEGKVGAAIRHEGSQVYRISDGGLYRIAGFYEGDTTQNFIAISSFLKKKEKNSAKERDIYAKVVEVKKSSLYLKVGLNP